MTFFYKKLVAMLMVAITIVATGCSSSPEEKAAREKAEAEAKVKADYKRQHPNVSVIGTFDGCEVKYYERGYTSENFYIAKCVNSESSTTVSSTQRTSGKYAHDIGKFEVTQAISKERAEIEKQQKYIDEARAKVEELKKKQSIIDAAKQKLTQEEIEALNLK